MNESKTGGTHVKKKIKRLNVIMSSTSSIGSEHSRWIKTFQIIRVVRAMYDFWGF